MAHIKTTNITNVTYDARYLAVKCKQQKVYYIMVKTLITLQIELQHSPQSSRRADAPAVELPVLVHQAGVRVARRDLDRRLVAAGRHHTGPAGSGA